AAMSLQAGALYIIIFDRGVPDSFHWGLYHHTSSDRGIKYHIKQMGSSWIADHGETGGATKSIYLIGFLRIAQVPADKVGDVNHIITNVPYTSVPGLDCVTWTMESIRRLVNAGFVRCSKLAELQDEVQAFAVAEHENAEQNKQPRPIQDSRLC
ncbi:hypothetical protein GLOTRDRAFT_4621, partial [Gloeophyllum trabeum ATCC 11539]